MLAFNRRLGVYPSYTSRPKVCSTLHIVHSPINMVRNDNSLQSRGHVNKLIVISGRFTSTDFGESELANIVDSVWILSTRIHTDNSLYTHANHSYCSDIPGTLVPPAHTRTHAQAHALRPHALTPGV